jgi:hypothetical protein
MASMIFNVLKSLDDLEVRDDEAVGSGTANSTPSRHKQGSIRRESGKIPPLSLLGPSAAELKLLVGFNKYEQTSLHGAWTMAAIAASRGRPARIKRGQAL